VVATTATSSPLNPIPPVPTDGPGAPPTWPAEATQFSAFKTTAAYRKNAAPASQNVGGTVNVDGYLQTVMSSNKAIWSEIFKGSGLSMPALTYDITSRSDRYVSACTRSGEKIVVTPAYDKLFYCSADNQPYGTIALPTSVLASVWKKDANRQLADLVVATSTSRQASLIILKSLEQQLNPPKPTTLGRQYTASCLAGVWAHAIYAQNAFTDKDLAVALAQTYSIPSEVDGAVTSPGPSDSVALTSWIVGFRGGDPGECGLHFWSN
jgi:predicted metalloprotease